MVSLTEKEELMYLIVQIPPNFLLQCLVTVTSQYTEGTSVSLAGVNLGTSGKVWGRPGFSHEHTVQSMQTTCAHKKQIVLSIGKQS